MRILHTSDWHLGKKLEGRDRLSEQRALLQEIADIAEESMADVVLVAGDVFDTFTPSSAAEEAFYDGVTEISAGRRPVVVISGNHDDEKRLCAVTPFSDRMGVYILGNISDVPKISRTNMPVKAVKGGEGYILFERDGEYLYVNALPYPSETRFKEAVKEGESFNEKIRRWVQKGFSGNDCNYPQILLSHFFALGAVSGGEEREIELGGAKAVDKNYLPPCAYTALGHIHKYMAVDSARNIHYSGSVLQYSFDEINDKFVLTADIDAQGCKNFRKIPLKSGIKLKRLSADGLERAQSLLSENTSFYVELELAADRPLTRAENRELRLRFPNLVSLKLSLKGIEAFSSAGRRGLSRTDLLRAYYSEVYGGEIPGDVLALYCELMEELE